MATCSESDFLALLQDLGSGDNAVRNQAEKNFDALKANNNMNGQLPFYLLSSVTSTSVPGHVRTLAAVLLRRELMKDDSMYHAIATPEAQSAFRLTMLKAVDTDEDMKMRGRIVELIGELYARQMDVDEWPELLTYVVEALHSGDVTKRETGFGLLGMLPQEALKIVFSGENFVNILSIFQSSLLDDNYDGRVMLQALRSLASIFGGLTKWEHFEPFKVLAEPLFQGLELSISGVLSGRIRSPIDYPTFGEVSHDLAYSQTLVDMADTSYNFFCEKMDIFFDPMVKLIDTKELRPEIRHLLLEFLVSLSEGSPKDVRKFKGPMNSKGYFFVSILPTCVRMMLTIKDKNFDTWGNIKDGDDDDRGEDDDDEYTDTDADMGESSLDRICKALGATGTQQLVSAQITSLLADTTHWANSYVALRIIGNYVEVTGKLSEENLKAHRQEVINVVVAYAAHPDQRVQDACFFAISGFLYNHGRSLTEQQLDTIMGIVLSSVHSCAQVCPRLRRQYIETLVHFIDYIDANLLEKYTGSILEQTISALSIGPQKVQEECIAAIISLSESIKGPQIAMYYDAVVPILKQLLEYARCNKLDILYGQTMECCAMFGEASGKDKFYQDALEMMNSMGQLDTELTDESNIRPYLMKACVRVARCLETEFSPFLPFIMGHLLKAVSQDIQILSNDIDDLEDELDNQSDVEYVETDDGWVAVRTSVVEEQGAAMNLILLLAEKLQALFYPYVEQTFQVVLPLLKSPHEDIRSFAVACLPDFIKSTGKALAPRETLLNYSNGAMGEIVNLLKKEDSPEIICTALGTLNYCLIYTCADWSNEVAPCDPMNYTTYLTQEQIEILLQAVKMKLQEAIQRRAVLKAEGLVSGGGDAFDDEDEADEKELVGSNNELFYNIDNLLNAIMETHGEAAIQPYENILREMVVNMAHKHCLREDREFAITVISDLIRLSVRSEGTAQRYYPEILPILINDVGSNTNSDSRQKCASAICAACNKFPALFLPFIADALQALGQCAGLGEQESRESSIHAVGCILIKIESLGVQITSIEYVWMQWLDSLPLRFDVTERATVVEQLIALYSNNHYLIADEKLTESILRILYQVLKENLVSGSLRSQVLEFLANLKHQRMQIINGTASMTEIAELLRTEFGV